MWQVLAASFCGLIVIAALLAAMPEMDDHTKTPESGFDL